MAFVVADRVKETTTSTGTGSYTLGGAVDGFRLQFLMVTPFTTQLLTMNIGKQDLVLMLLREMS